MDFGQLSVSHTSPVARATSDWSSPTASPISRLRARGWQAERECMMHTLSPSPRLRARGWQGPQVRTSAHLVQERRTVASCTPAVVAVSAEKLRASCALFSLPRARAHATLSGDATRSRLWSHSGLRYVAPGASCGDALGVAPWRCHAP